MSRNAKRPVEVSIVFPAFNEVNVLEGTVERTIVAAESFADSYEIIIAEDGSTDGTDRLSDVLGEKHSSVVHIHGEKRLGRGLALTNAFGVSRGEIIVYMDVDLATDLKYLASLCAAIKTEGYDLATGSRMLAESNVERSFSRQFSSRFFNFLVRLMLGSRLKDHQCGFKAFRRDSVLPLLKEVRAKHWFWDTEILVRAARRGCRIKEMPVEWKSGRQTRVNLVRDSFNMGKQVFQLWWQLRSD